MISYGLSNPLNAALTKNVDRILWYSFCILVSILIFLSFFRIGSYEAFVDLKSSSLRIEFSKNSKEEKIVEFGAGTTVIGVSDTPHFANMAGADLLEISALSQNSSLRFEAGDTKRSSARLCLLHGDYFVSTQTQDGAYKEQQVRVHPDTEACADVVIKEDFLAYPHVVAVEPRLDSRGVELYPDMVGTLRIQDTNKELALTSGMTLHLIIEKKPPTIMGFVDGYFTIHAWKRIQVLWSDRDKLVTYTYTPLDRLKKYAEDNGLWFSISFLIGIVFGVRRLLSLY